MILLMMLTCAMSARTNKPSTDVHDSETPLSTVGFNEWTESVNAGMRNAAAEACSERQENECVCKTGMYT